MKTVILKAAVALAAALATVPAMAQGNGLAVTVNGQQVTFPGQGPVENQGRVLVPLRGVLEQLGAYVSYDSDLREVKAVRNEAHITLPIGSRTAQIDGRAVPLDVPARILNGSTMVPLRFVAESLGARVDYEAALNTVAIRTGARGDSGPMSPPRPFPMDSHRVVRGVILSVRPDQNRLVIRGEDGVRRNIGLTPDYRARRHTPGGDITIDLDRLHPGDMVGLEMQDGQARTVTLFPDRSAH